jgi:hypothetical protein
MSDLETICIKIEDILGNGPAKEPRDYPTVGCSHGYHPNDPDAPEDTVAQEAFNEGVTRGWFEACQMLEPILEALRTLAPNTGMREALVALADGADKCAEAPHFIVQPFLDIYREHGDVIAQARAALTPQGDRNG